MSTTLSAPAPIDVRGVHTRPGLGRLVRVEVRKAVDTRAGLGLAAAIVLLAVAVVVARLATGTAADHTFAAVLDQASMPAAVLLPVVWVLMVTSEWTLRTGLTTFALVPDRSRVLLAKVLAGLVLGLGALAVTLAAVAAGVLVAGPADGAWADAPALIGQAAVYVVTGVLMAVGFSLLLRGTAPALVALYALPAAWMGILTLAPDVAPWLDTGRALAPMHHEVLRGTQWAQAATALALWMALPLAAGLWRSARQDPVA